MPYDDKYIKVDSSEKDLNKKIKNLITEADNEIFWYIRFNLPLYESSVSEKTMKVTDVGGHIIKTKIIYNKQLELIIISPIQKFKKDEYYILRISKKVKSENQQNIKKDVNILFKIKEGQLVDFEELPENIVLPKAKKSFRLPVLPKKQTHSRVYNFTEDQQKKLEDAQSQERLPYLNLKVNPLLALAGSAMFFAGTFANIRILATLGIFAAIAGFTIIFMQMRDPEFKSSFYYNLGAFYFNREKYFKSNKNFEKSIELNPNNEFAEYALNKASFYL